MKIPVPETLHLHSPELAGRIAALPAAPGVYLLGLPGRPPHVAWCANLQRRLRRLLLPQSRAGAGLLERLQGAGSLVHYWATGSKLESSLLTYELVKGHFPNDYLKRLRLRIPWFLALANWDPFPRVILTNRLPPAAGPVFGPFLNRDTAQRYEQEVLALFEVRRCTEILAPHPDHPGCIYGEMKQCLRPCQCAVSPGEYAAEVGRLEEFLETNGRSVVTVLSLERERACNDLNFEEAAQIHKRLEKINATVALRDSVVTELGAFNGVALTRGAGERSFRLWLMSRALWQNPIHLDFAPENLPAKSLDHQLRELVAQGFQSAVDEGNRLEHLALFSRWYYSSWRDGSWFPFQTPPDLNYRRLVREISNVVKTQS